MPDSTVMGTGPSASVAFDTKRPAINRSDSTNLPRKVDRYSRRKVHPGMGLLVSDRRLSAVRPFREAMRIVTMGAMSSTGKPSARTVAITSSR